MLDTRFLIAVFEFVLLLFSLSFHECAHAWMASRLGDQTARLEGRITLNPMYHVDPVGTLLFPALIIFGPFIGFSFFSGFLVGWAKPTPVITRNFRKIVRDDNLTTLAGPVSNLMLGASLPFAVSRSCAVALPNGREVVQSSFIAALNPGGPMTMQPVALLCSLAILINLSLFFFNLLPDSAARWQPRGAQSAALQRRPGLRPHSHLGQLPAHDLSWAGVIMGLLLRPSLQFVFNALIHI